jgi:hypothetical protein
MKITNFSTLIISPDTDKIVSVFNELGFVKQHEKSFSTDDDVTSTVLVDGDGHMISIAAAPVPRDMTVIRMNVDNFEEAYEFLKAKGFVNAKGADKVEDTGTSKAALLLSPSGFAISLSQHII